MNATARTEIVSRYEQHVARFERDATNWRRLGRTAPVAQTAEPAPGILPLTEREQTMLELVAQGLTDDEIGAECGISEFTVKTHLRRLYVKLSARNRAHAVAIGVANDLLHLKLAS